MNFIASSPNLGLSGANVLLAQLFSGFKGLGHQAGWLITAHQGGADCHWLNGMGLDFHSLPPTPAMAVRRRQRLLIDALESAKPCVYFPNFDFDMLWAARAFPSDCRTVFIMHSDDPVYYEAIERRGGEMDAIVCVSSYLAKTVREHWPALRTRVHHIPFGVDVPKMPFPAVRSSAPEDVLEVAYCGRLAQEQKRILDLAEIVLACHAENMPIRFHVAGTGPQEEEFFAAIHEPLAAGRVVRHGLLANEQVSALLQRCHLFILTSAYEGLPVSLLEAMAAGCVPVVTHVASGVPEVIREGIDGYLHPIGDTAAMVTRLNALNADRSLLATKSAAVVTRITEGGYTRPDSIGRYLDLATGILSIPRVCPLGNQLVLPPHYRFAHRLKSCLASTFRRVAVR